MCGYKKISHTSLLAAFENDSWIKKTAWDVSSINKKLLNTATLTLKVLADPLKTTGNVRNP